MILSLEQQVTSLESSKKLKELGFRQESLFYWCYFQGQIIVCYWETCLDKGLGEIICSAYTASELGELLPKMFSIDKWCSCGFVITIPGIEKRFHNESLAEVMALMLIHPSSL